MQIFTDFSHHIRLRSRTAPFVRYAALMISVFLLAGCSSSLQLTSRWSNSNVKIDGVDSEWRDALTYARASDASLGVKNDTDYLYVCFTTSNRQRQVQMLAFGCTAWFSQEGKEERFFGIHFPLGGQFQALRLLTQENATEELQQLIQASQRDLELVGPAETDRRRVMDRQAAGIEARLAYSEETFVYELKVPLRKTVDHPFAIGTGDLHTISVGFETGQIRTTPGGQQTSPSMMSTPSRGRRGGRSGGGASSSAGRMGSERLERLSLWATVQLASSAAPAAK